MIAQDFEARLRSMFEWIATLADDGWKLPHLGDCDDGRVELLFDDIAQTMLPAGERHSLRVGSLYGLASPLLQMHLCGIGEAGLAPAGLRNCLAPLRRSGGYILRDAEWNPRERSHTHCDKLSIVFRLGPDEVFCDSGSRCYTRSAELRNLDRSTRVAQYPYG